VVTLLLALVVLAVVGFGIYLVVDMVRGGQGGNQPPSDGPGARHGKPRAGDPDVYHQRPLKRPTLSGSAVQRPQAGTVAHEAARLLGKHPGEWLFVSDPSDRTASGAETGHYVRVTTDPDPGNADDLIIERLTASDFTGRKSGDCLEVTVFFASANNDHVTKGALQVTVGPLDPQTWERPVPLFSHTAGPIVRFPMDGYQGRADKGRLAGQLSRAVLLS
jgi:hypothetical protein